MCVAFVFDAISNPSPDLPVSTAFQNTSRRLDKFSSIIFQKFNQATLVDVQCLFVSRGCRWMQDVTWLDILLQGSTQIIDWHPIISILFHTISVTLAHALLETYLATSKKASTSSRLPPAQFLLPLYSPLLWTIAVYHPRIDATCIVNAMKTCREQKSNIGSFEPSTEVEAAAKVMKEARKESRGSPKPIIRRW